MLRSIPELSLFGQMKLPLRNTLLLTLRCGPCGARGEGVRVDGALAAEGKSLGGDDAL